MTDLMWFVMSEHTFVASYEKTGLIIQQYCLACILHVLVGHFSAKQKQNFGNRGAIEILLNIIKSKLPTGLKTFDYNLFMTSKNETTKKFTNSRI